MFRQKQYAEMTVSSSSLALAIENSELEEDPSADFSAEEEASREFERKALLDAKIEKSIRIIEQTKERRRSSIEEQSAVLLAGSNHSNVDIATRTAARERRKRASELSVSEHYPVVNKQKATFLGLSVSEHGTTRPAQSNRKSEVDLDTHQGHPLRAADVRRRRKSTNDDPSAEDKRRARLVMVQNRRQRASISAGEEGQRERNCRELILERFETRPRLRKFDSKRSQSLDDDILGMQSKTTELKTLTQRRSPKQRLSGGSGCSGKSCPNRARERLQRSNFRRALSIDSNSPGLSKESTRRISSRRKLSIEREAVPAESIRRRKVASALALSELGNVRPERGSIAQSVASRRRECGSSRNSSPRIHIETVDESPQDKKNFTWTWKNNKMEPTLLRRSIESSGPSKTSPSQIKDAVRSLFVQDFSSPLSSNAKHSGRSSMPPSSDVAKSDHRIPSHLTPQQQRPPNKTSKFAISFLTPGARRTSHASEHHVSPVERATSYPNLLLSSPELKSKPSKWKNNRGSKNQSWQVSNSKNICLDVLRIEDVVNKKDIGNIAEFLKQSNQAEEDLERRKEQDRQARRSHVRARRRQTSIEWAS